MLDEGRRRRLALVAPLPPSNDRLLEGYGPLGQHSDAGHGDKPVAHSGHQGEDLLVGELHAVELLQDRLSPAKGNTTLIKKFLNFVFTDSNVLDHPGKASSTTCIDFNTLLRLAWAAFGNESKSVKPNAEQSRSQASDQWSMGSSSTSVVAVTIGEVHGPAPDSEKWQSQRR